MPPTVNATARRAQIHAALASFSNTKLQTASTKLLNALGYSSEKTTDLGNDAETFLNSIAAFKPELGNINRDKVVVDRDLMLYSQYLCVTPVVSSCELYFTRHAGPFVDCLSQKTSNGKNKLLKLANYFLFNLIRHAIAFFSHWQRSLQNLTS